MPPTFRVEIDSERAELLSQLSMFHSGDTHSRHDATVKPHESFRRRVVRSGFKLLAFAGLTVSLSSGYTAARDFSEINNTGSEFVNNLEDAGLIQQDRELADGEGNTAEEVITLIQGIQDVATNTAEEASANGNKLVNRLSTTLFSGLVGLSSIAVLGAMKRKDRSHTKYLKGDVPIWYDTSVFDHPYRKHPLYQWHASKLGEDDDSKVVHIADSRDFHRKKSANTIGGKFGYHYVKAIVFGSTAAVGSLIIVDSGASQLADRVVDKVIPDSLNVNSIEQVSRPITDRFKRAVTENMVEDAQTKLPNLSESLKAIGLTKDKIVELVESQSNQAFNLTPTTDNVISEALEPLANIGDYIVNPRGIKNDSEKKLPYHAMLLAVGSSFLLASILRGKNFGKGALVTENFLNAHLRKNNNDQ